MLPTVLESGLLPDGEHSASWGEVVSAFGRNEHRKALIAGLRRACEALARSGCRRLWIDGSFVTAKAVPRDYDACWDPDGVDPNKLDPVLMDWSSSGRLRMKAKYMGDLFIAGTEASTGLPFVEFFRKDRDGTPKGVVVIDPGGV